MRILGAYHLILFHTVPLIAVPEDERALARAIGEAHQRYSRMRNFAERMRGYLFQGRFGSCVIGREAFGGGGPYGYGKKGLGIPKVGILHSGMEDS